MKTSFILEALLIFVCWRPGHSSTFVIDVVVVPRNNDHTFSCTISSPTSLTRWTYSLTSTESTQTSLMSYQNGSCTMSPFYSFPSENIQISYSCSGITYNVTSHATGGNRNNHILSCRDANQPDISGSTWMIIIIAEEGDHCNCNPTIPFNIREITEGENVTFICNLSSDVRYVNWDRNIGSNTAAMGVNNGQCTASGGTTFLGNTSKYIYTCNNTAYQVTILNVSRSEHNDMYMCTPFGQLAGTGLNWIIQVKAPVISVTITSSTYLVNIAENTSVEFICKTSTARPAASVNWYRYPNGNCQTSTQITDNITITTDYDDFSVTTSILRFVPTRQDNDTKINCKANNSINTSPVSSKKKLLSVMYKANVPHIIQGSEYRVIENTSGMLSCTVKGGNPTPTLSWSCKKFSPTNQSTINSNGNVTTTLTWTPSRTREGTCTCTSEQVGFTTDTVNVATIILYPPSTPVLKVNGNSADGDVYFIEGNNRSINCTAHSKPSPDKYTWTGPRITDSIHIQTLNFPTVKKEDAGQYKCSVHNTMNLSIGGSVVGINDMTVNVVVLYPPAVMHMKDIAKLKDEQFNTMCNYTAGIPNTTSFQWTRNIDNTVWKTATLNIESLKKIDTGIYTCTASNTMKQTGDDKSYIGQHSQSFYLDVQYKTVIHIFTINGFTSQVVTLNESDPIRIMCYADSNPTAVMTLRHESKTLVTVTSNSVEYHIAKAGCSDAGIFFCSARNIHNEINHILQLFVNCIPRAEHEVEMFIKSANNEKITITFKVIAYPPPIFTWFRLVQDNWMELENDGNYFIQSTDLQSTFIIVNVGVDDFTSYKVVAENKLGSMEQVYVLSSYENDIPSSTPGALIGGIVGGVTGCIVIVVVIIVIIRRYTSCNVCSEQLSRDKSDRSNKSAEEQAYYNTGRPEDITNENNDATAYDEIGSVTNTNNNSAAEDSITNNVPSVNNYEMVNLNNVESTPYSLLDQTEQRTTSDTTSGENKSEYENMKIRGSLF